MRALESIAICRPADAATGSTRGVSTLGHRKRLPADHDGRLYCLTKEGLVPELLPFYQCASPQQYQWAKEESAPADEIADGNRSMLSEGAKAAR